MSVTKQEEHLASKTRPEEAPAPAYDAHSPAGPSSASTQRRVTSSADSPKLPTAENPFNFPSDSDSDSALPTYSEASASREPPIAIPQQSPTQSSPFLNAYAPALLGHGITHQAWTSFLDTISAFMTAKVGDRAINHAGDVANKIGQYPANYVKTVEASVKDVGSTISRRAKNKNYLGAVSAVIGGAITIPLGAVLGAVGTVCSFPIHAIAVVLSRPKTPAERAVAYVAVANHKWLNKRGLHATLVNTDQLSEVVGVSVKALLEASADGKDAGPLGPWSALRDCIAPLETEGPGVVDIGAETWWLVLVKAETA
ncbi:hypothetical protein F66182_5415 [Fusarium sp. NRRL 66182]|nr:hypothetical protein F66182_5415 [Fusarium sp. NRRL 66182]